MYEFIFLIGRIIVGVYYIFNGFNHLGNLKMLTQYAAMKGVPSAKFFVVVTGLLLLYGGLSILLGFIPLLGIIALLIFLIPTTFTMHNFWAIQDQQMKMVEMVNFMKNWALIGSLLMFLAIPTPWVFSL